MTGNKNLILAVFLLVTLIGAGTTGYIILESYSLPDALYMTIITISTVGFGEIRPLSEIGRIFTSGLIIFGFGALAFFGQTIISMFLEKFMSHKSELRRMKRQIDQLKGHFIICGMGRVGAVAVERFIEAGVGFVIIESDSATCQELQEKDYLYLEGDAINEEKLVEAGIKSARGLLAILPSDPDNLFITLSARELNPTLHIIARAGNPSTEKKLLRAGADSVLSPYTSAGNLIASEMLAACGYETFRPAADTPEIKPCWVEVSRESWMNGKSIADIEDANEETIVGLRRGNNDWLDPEKSIQVEAGDKIMVLAKQVEDDLLPADKSILNQKIVIVDDNPVILRLYTRLLHRAGFIPLSAVNGQEAADLIIREKPQAAVIDFMLPILSGIEVCEKVRQALPGEDLKLILFTSDENEETRQRAMAAGADKVLIKSAEASDLVQHVIELLSKNSKTPAARPREQRQIAIKAKTKTSEAPRDNTSSQENATGNDSPQAPLFQPEALLKTCDGDRELALEIIDIFLEDSQELIQQISTALQEQDQHQLQVAAHTLKGAASNFGETPLYHQAKSLEQMGRDGNLTTANLSVELLQQQLRQFHTELSAYKQHA